MWAIIWRGDSATTRHAGIGRTISTVALKAILVTLDEVEGLCRNLDRRAQFLGPGDSFRPPSDTLACQYTFLHSLYQEVLYERAAATYRRDRGKKESARNEIIRLHYGGAAQRRIGA